jgi:quercetin dioxygenase-like cupin family protein
MTDPAPTSPQSSVPADDPTRHLTVAQPDTDESLVHLGVVGDTYTILLTGEDTAGKYTLIDMHVPPGGGPPPHRHDFEEMFTVLDGEVELTFRGESLVAKPGDTVNVPANAPHRFHNASGHAVRLLCLCAPAGQEEFFEAVGIPVATRTEAPPELDEESQAAFIRKSVELAPHYHTDLLSP